MNDSGKVGSYTPPKYGSTDGGVDDGSKDRVAFEVAGTDALSTHIVEQYHRAGECCAPSDMNVHDKSFSGQHNGLA